MSDADPFLIVKLFSLNELFIQQLEHTVIFSFLSIDYSTDISLFYFFDSY